MDWIFWIKLLHTLVFLFVSGCIVYVVYCGISGTSNRYLWAAAGIVLSIGILYAANGFECPLATLVHTLAGRKDISDIFFPDWFANKIMSVSAAIYVFGMLLVLYKKYRKIKSGDAADRAV